MGDMENKVAKISATPDQTSSQPAPQTPAAVETGPVQSRIAQGALDQADLRLVIEEQAGTYVYKTVDRRTGDVVAQYPREDILKLRETDEYVAGDVIKAKV
jgi:flagellar protein FlaG